MVTRSLRSRVRDSEVVSCVESGLDAVRSETKLTGAPLKEKSNDSLFFVDSEGVDEPKRQKLKDAGLLYKRPLKIEEILKSDSTHSPIKSTEKKTAKSADAEKIAKMAKNRHLNNVDAEGKASKLIDVWNAPSNDLKNLMPSKYRPSGPVIKSKPTLIPNPGTSYRPTVEEYNSLANEAVQIEITRENSSNAQVEKELKLQMLSGTSYNAMDAAIEGILNGGDFKDEEDELCTDGNQENMQKSDNFKKASSIQKRPSKKQIRHNLKLKAQTKNKTRLESEKRMIQDLVNVKNIAKQVKRELDASRKIAKNKKAPSKKTILARMSNSSFIAPLLAVQLEEDKADCLRRLKPEGNVIVDRYKGFQERTLIEPIAAKRFKSKPRGKYKKYDRSKSSF